MSSTSIDYASQPSGGIFAWLTGIVEEGGALLVRLLAYLSGIAMLALIAADLVAGPSGQPVTDLPAQPGWSAASRPHPAFAVSASDFPNKTMSYEILRHPEGGRKDTLQWMADPDRTPVAEIELYRAGDELASFAAPASDLLARMGLPATATEPEPAGLVGTKFGKVALWRLPGAAPACLGFTRDFDDPRLRISGWSCQADNRPAQRSLIGCTLDRLVLLSAGNDPKLAELFAHAELKRGDCGGLPTASADWVNSVDTPLLRGRL